MMTPRVENTVLGFVVQSEQTFRYLQEGGNRQGVDVGLQLSPALYHRRQRSL